MLIIFANHVHLVVRWDSLSCWWYIRFCRK